MGVTKEFGSDELKNFDGLKAHQWKFLPLEDNIQSGDEDGKREMFSTFYKHVLKGMEWIRKLLENPTCNNRILIHCTSGMNRSVAFTEAYLLLNPNRMVGVPTREVTAEMRAERAGIDFPDDSKAARLRLQAMDAVVKTRHGARADTAYDVCLNSIAENVALYGSKNAVSILRKRPASSGAYVCIAHGFKSKLEQPMHPRRKTTGFTLGS